MKRVILLMAIIFTFASLLNAAPANPYITIPVNIDGKTYELREWGDEYMHGFETIDGYTVIYDEAQKKWFYALKTVVGEVFATKIPLGKALPESTTIDKHLRHSGEYLESLKEIWTEKRPHIDDKIIQKTVHEGEENVPLLCVDFPDIDHTFSSEDFQEHIFSKNPDSPKSMTDYYEEISGGKFHINGDAFGWYTSENNQEYYGANVIGGLDIRPQELVTEAVKAADSLVDFSKYDNDGDGLVDAVIIVYAGEGESYYNTNALYAHRGFLFPVCETDDGVVVSSYTMQPEISSYESNISPIGVFCHEYGHSLGLPDLYDLDTVFGSEEEDTLSAGIGGFGLMSHGCFNTCNGVYGDCPAHPTPYSRALLGWDNTIVIDETGDYTFDPVEEGGKIYRITAGLPVNEYFLIENRQKILFDGGLPGEDGGILIWHIDETRFYNTEESRKLVDLEQAQPVQTLDISYYNQGDDNDFFRIGKEFTDISRPNTRSNYGHYSGIDITDISEVNPDGSMSFYAEIDSELGMKWWKYKTKSSIGSTPALAKDGTIYIPSGDQNIYAINPDGTLQWTFETDNYFNISSPTVGPDGTIYCGSWDNFFYAINPDGTLKWKFETENNINSNPAVGDDGTVYIGSEDKNFYAFNPDGTLKWMFETLNPIYGSPAVSADGTIIFGGYDGNVYALTPDGLLKWEFKTDYIIYAKPVIDEDGTIYVGSYDSYLYALNPDGTLKWSFKTGNAVYASPTIGDDGLLYVPSCDGSLYCIDKDANLQWTFATYHGQPLYATPVLGSDGTLYFGSFDSHFYAVNPDGSFKWRFLTGYNIVSSPVMNEANGTIYLSSYDSSLYAVQVDKPEYNIIIDMMTQIIDDTINLEIYVTYTDQPIPADYYLAMMSPSGELYFAPDWTHSVAPLSEDFTFTKPPYIYKFSNPSANPPISSTGTYTFFMLAVTPNTADMLSEISMTTVVIK